MKLEMFEWIDHWSLTGKTWFDAEEVNDVTPLRIMTVGWVVKENKEMVSICASYGENRKFSGQISLLKSAILNRWVLKDPGVKIRGKADGWISKTRD